MCTRTRLAVCPLRDAPSAAVAASLSREGAVNADRSPRPSLLHPLHWQGQPRLPGAPDPFRAPSTMYHSSAPLLPPPSPYLYFPCVRLHCTMPCYGTPRVCVLECPPLGRPSLITLVHVNSSTSASTAWRLGGHGLPFALKCTAYTPRAAVFDHAQRCVRCAAVLAHSEASTSLLGAHATASGARHCRRRCWPR